MPFFMDKNLLALISRQTNFVEVSESGSSYSRPDKSKQSHWPFQSVFLFASYSYPHTQYFLCRKNGPERLNTGDFCCCFDKILQRSFIYWVFNIRSRRSCAETALPLLGRLEVCFLGWLFLNSTHTILLERPLYTIDPEKFYLLTCCCSGSLPDEEGKREGETPNPLLSNVWREVSSSLVGWTIVC